jgi:translation initiation factor 1
MGEKNKVISWDAFQLLGNPENAPEEIQDEVKDFKITLYVHYEKKGRGGKEAIIIRGFEGDHNHDLEKLCKIIKSKLGTGGSVKDNEIIIQGNQREKIMELLTNEGFKKLKRVGG